VFVFDVLLVCVGALAVGASTIAPVAENHAFRQRLIALCAWLPVPLLISLKAAQPLIVAQLTFFVALGLIVSWVHFANPPMLLRVHLEPFSRRGPAGVLAGLLLQPGWPSAVLFLGLVEVLYSVSLHWALSAKGDITSMSAVAVMAGAALMTPPLIWRLLRIPSRQTLIAHTLFLVFSGLLFAILKAIDDVSMGAYQIAAIFPPLGFFVMLDGGLKLAERSEWLLAGSLMFLLLAALLLFLSRQYWRQLFALSRDIRSTPKREQVSLEVAA
jgi:hypothetical protein